MGDKRLQAHCVILSNRLDLDRLLPFLRQEQMLTRDEYETLTNVMFSPKQRRERLIITILPRKGMYHFENFAKCLVWSGQAELARHIGVDVDKVPPYPHQPPPPSPQAGGQAGNTGNNQELVDALRGLIQEHAANGSHPPPVSNSHLPYPNLSPSHSAPSASLPHTASQPPLQPYQTNPAAQAMPNSAGGAHVFNPAQATPNIAGGTPNIVGEACLSNPSMGNHSVGASTAHAQDPSQHPRLDPALMPPSAARQPVPALIPPSAARQPVPGLARVFILYCKDDLLLQEYGTPCDDFFQDVLELADTLVYCGGFHSCTVDFYEHNQQQNWDIWTQQKIEESTHVVMVCSPQLKRHLSTRERQDIMMNKGMCFSDTLVNIVRAPKFVPVFLNHCKPANPKDWLPLQLHAARFFWLSHLRELYQDIHAQEYSDLERNQVLVARLGDPKHKELASLVGHLRGEPEIVAPVPPRVPVQLPSDPAHISPVPQRHVRAQVPASHVWPPPASYVSPTGAEYIPDEIFVKIAQRLPADRDWNRLGVKLGVEYSRIKRLQQEHASDYVLAVLEVFRIWQQTMGRGATKRVLKRALVEMNYGRLADECFANVRL